MKLNRAKAAIITAGQQYDKYLDNLIAYNRYNNLPWYKKWFTTKINKPTFYYYNEEIVYSDFNTIIVLRVFYTETSKLISLAINELGNGYSLNIETMQKTPFLGRRKSTISKESEERLLSIRNILAPLIVE